VSLLLVDSLFAPCRKNSAPLTGAVAPGSGRRKPGAGKPVRPFRSVSQLILLSVRLDFLRKHGCNLVSAHKLFQEGTLLFLDLLLQFALPRR